MKTHMNTAQGLLRRHWLTMVLLGASQLACCLAAVSDGQEPVAQPQQSSGTGQQNPMYMLTYDHGGLVLWGHDHFVEHLREAIAWLDRYPDFKIGLENEAYTYDALAREAPQVLDEIRADLKRYRGRFGIGTCTYGQPLSVFINEESNIRQIEYALDADRRHFDSAPDVYLMSEHAMHSQIPQLLAGFGFRGAIMRTHYMMYGYNPTFDVPIGWWEGVDGSRIATIPTYVGQGAQFGRTTKDNWILTRYPSSQCTDSLDDFRKEFAHINPLLATRADDAGLRREGLVREYQGRPGFQWLLLEEILPTFPEPQEVMRTAPNDFHVRMPWGYCGNEIWDQCRRAEVAVLTAERLATLAMIVGGDKHEVTLEKAWKNLLVAQHHDIQICGLLDDARRFLPASRSASDTVIDLSMRHMAQQMEGGTAGQITVFNPLSWSCKRWIEVPVSLLRGVAQDVRVERNGAAVPAAVLAADRYSDGSLRTARLAFQANLEPLSLASFSIEPDAESVPEPDSRFVIDAERLSLKTPFVEVQFGANGGIVSMRDARNKVDWLQEQPDGGIIAGRIDGEDCQSQGKWSFSVGRDAAPWAIARQVGFVGPIPYELEMTFSADTPRIDCRCRFRFNGEQIGQISDNKRDHTSGFVHEHKLRFKLFPAVNDQAVGVRDLPFAVSETADRYVNGLHWAGVTDGKSGLAYLNQGSMGALREADGGFSLPLAFAMHYVWGTRMLSGEYSYDFALLPFQGSWRDANLQRQALAYNYPPVSLATEAGNGQLGNVFAPLEVASPNVMLSALYSKKGKIFARFYEHHGQAGVLQLNYRHLPSLFVEVDLAGREQEDLSTPLPFRPWQIRTMEIRPVP